MKCIKCGYEAKENDKFCYKCGNSLIVENEGLHCECGAEITEEDKFCGKCGKRLNENEVIKNEEVLYCKICNSVVDEKDNYCLSCGSKLKEDVDIISSNKKEPVIVGYVSQAAIWFSILCLGLSFLLSSFGILLPIITGIISLGALAFAILKYRRVNHRLNVWAMIISVLAILVSGIGITNNLVEKDYAYKIPEEIGTKLGIEFPDVKPSFYNITIMNGTVTTVVFKGYANNEVVLKLSIDQADLFVDNYGYLFTDVFKADLKEYFGDLLIDDAYVSIVYDVDKKTFEFPSNMEEDYNLIIINYYTNEDWIQILEISKRE